MIYLDDVLYYLAWLPLFLNIAVLTITVFWALIFIELCSNNAISSLWERWRANRRKGR